MELSAVKQIGIKELAQAAGVAPSTVSRALAGNPRISKETAERILRTAADLGYQPHTSRTRFLALFLPGLMEYTYTGLLLKAIQREAFRRNYRLELLLPDGLPRMNERYFCGGIALGKVNLESCPFPLVQINGKAESLNRNSFAVCSDDFGAIAESVRRFRAAGHVRIGFLLAGNPDTCNNRNRIAAFRQVLPEDPEKWIEIIPNSEYEVDAALIRLMKRGITALLYLVPSAVNPEKVMRRNRIRIPEDLSLIVWEMLGIFQEYRPNLCVAEQNFERLAFESLERIASSFAGKPGKKTVFVPYVFREGASIVSPRSGARSKHCT